jgi:hypothetical protein
MRYLFLLALLFMSGQVWATHSQDACSGALMLTVPSSGVVTSTGATTDAVPACSPATPQSGIWFSVVGNGHLLRFSDCNMSTTGDQSIQVFSGDCANLECVGGSNATFCHINTMSAMATWCSEAGVTYYIHLGSKTGGVITADYNLTDRGICNYIGGNCVPETVFAPHSFTGDTDNRDDCCESDAADQHFVVHVPWTGSWHFLACGYPTHISVGTSFCANNICSASDNLIDPLPGCYPAGTCGCRTMAQGIYYVTIEKGYDDGDGGTFELRIQDCSGLNDVPPIEIDPAEAMSVCEPLDGEQYRQIIVRGDNLNPERPPLLTITGGCDFCGEAGMAPAGWEFDPNGWEFHPGSPNVAGQITPYWRNSILGTSTGFACFTLDGFLPVELLSFTTIAGDKEVIVRWSTGSESNLDEFRLLRDGELIATQDATNTSQGSSYSFTDAGLNNDVDYTYSLYSVELSGEQNLLAVSSATPSASAGVVMGFSLGQNYPNPFNPETSIEFSVADAGEVTLKVFDLTGRVVAVLLDGAVEHGAHTATFDARGLSSGIYFYTLEQNGNSLTKKMMLLK